MKKFITGLSLNKKLAFTALFLGFLALFGKDPFSRTFRTINTKDIAFALNTNSGKISPETLADMLIKEQSGFTLVDLRSESQFNTYNIPSSVNIPAVGIGKSPLSRNEKIILYSDDETAAAQAWFLLKASDYKSVYILEGGLNAWKEKVLFPKLSKDAGKDELAMYEKIKQVSIHFGGTPQTGVASDSAKTEISMPKLQAPASVSKTAAPKKKKEGC
ncbi:MAG: rhodanese-like domain-containing protein [Syntrophothermus sp.]